ncbi:hypothetical protein BKIR_c198_4201 [Candidatus Paraburkholderia kirkii UZHbot1]|uniref:Uncharacterized protein n=1 Tax=Candidatus Paraburkholderia kirkii UZHbot1 TaxID=1055526 RepID=G4M8Z6_9BURK|nr:hypothetical protein BKIR_c198_4201 [Candidatus Paraburkholderia kirkii UZHbot1]
MDSASPALLVTAAGLGAFHGLNPARGWLFAVALGLYARSWRVALVLAGALTLGMAVGHDSLARGCGALLIGWGVWRAWRGHRGRPTVGMRTGLAGLALWSFVMSSMSSTHGAGLMRVPALLQLCAGRASGGAFAASALALTVHTGAMLAVIAAISMLAMSVQERGGLGFLRSSWINVDWLWSVALIACGAFLFVQSRCGFRAPAPSRREWRKPA